MGILWIQLAVLSLSCFSCANSQNVATDSGEGCRCEYTEQPPSELLCDPYRNAELILECTVLFPFSSQVDKEVVWFRSQLQTQSPMSDSESDSWSMNRLDISQSNIQIREQSQASSATRNTWIRSQLIIRELNESSIGDYWCRIKADNEWLVPSDAIYLQPASAYSQFGECSSQLAQSKQERKCAAGWTSTDRPITGTERLTTESVSAGPSTTERISASATGGSETPGDGIVPEEDDRWSLTNELYISISILMLFGVMVMVLAPVTIYLFIRRKKQGSVRKPDLERVRPVNYQQRRSATLPMVASDYLVPQPFLTVSQQQSQNSWMSRQSGNRYNCNSTQGHEYEDVKVPIDSEHIYSNLTNSAVTMTVNEAYSACNTAERRREGAEPSRGSVVPAEPLSHNVVILNPLYIRTTSQEERISDDSGEYVDPSEFSYL